MPYIREAFEIVHQREVLWIGSREELTKLLGPDWAAGDSVTLADPGPTAPNYLAQNLVIATSQIEDSRDSAEAPGAQ